MYLARPATDWDSFEDVMVYLACSATGCYGVVSELSTGAGGSELVIDVSRPVQFCTPSRSSYYVSVFECV